MGKWFSGSELLCKHEDLSLDSSPYVTSLAWCRPVNPVICREKTEGRSLVLAGYYSSQNELWVQEKTLSQRNKAENDRGGQSKPFCGLYKHVYRNTHSIHTCTNITHTTCIYLSHFILRVYMCARVHTHMHVCTHMHVHTHTCTKFSIP